MYHKYAVFYSTGLCDNNSLYSVANINKNQPLQKKHYDDLFIICSNPNFHKNLYWQYNNRTNKILYPDYKSVQQIIR